MGLIGSGLGVMIIGLTITICNKIFEEVSIRWKVTLLHFVGKFMYMYKLYFLLLLPSLNFWPYTQHLIAPSREMITIELSVELKNLVLWIAGVDTVNVTSCFKAFTLCFLLASQYCRLAITWSVWKERGGVSHVLHFPVFLARLSNNSYVTNVILTSAVSVDLKYFFYSWKVVWNSRLKKWKSQEPWQREVYENTKEM